MKSIELSGKERRLKYDYNSVCDIEDKAKMPFEKLMLENAGYNLLRIVLWAGLKHENRGLTLEMTGIWIDKYIKDGGTLEELFENCLIALSDSGILGNVKTEG